MGWHNYSIYGLTLQSNRWLAGLVSAAEPVADAGFDFGVDLDSGWLPTLPTSAEVGWILAFPRAGDGSTEVIVWKLIAVSGTSSHLQFTVIAGRIAFVIDLAARRLWAQWSGEVTVDDVVSVLLGPGLGCVLRMHGVTCLHGSVVARGDRAAALIGHNGRGKSNTAAALTRFGLVDLADDIAVLSEAGWRFLVQPGYPRLRITPCVAKLVHEMPEALSPVHSSEDKRHVELAYHDDRLRRSFEPRPLPLEAIYYLGKGKPPDAQPVMRFVPYPHCLPMLAWHSYVDYVLDRPQRVREVESLGRLVACVPVRRVSRTNDLEDLPTVCDLVAADFEILAMA